jgi:hypothetical protein
MKLCGLPEFNQVVALLQLTAEVRPTKLCFAIGSLENHALRYHTIHDLSS